MKKWLLLYILLPIVVLAQNIEPDKIYVSSIHTVKLFQENNQESLPLINLNSNEQLELHFDDIDENAKNYYYSFKLCNANWQPADLSSFDYIKGYQQQRLSLYRYSSIALTKYVHYTAMLPDKNSIPTRSGNYLLMVFLNGDPTQLAFTKRFYVVNSKVMITGRIMQPFDSQIIQTHQKLQFSLDVSQLNAPNPVQQISLSAAQNNKWSDAITSFQPAFIRGSVLEYSGETDCLFEAGKEYRWADLRSFRYLSERIDKIDKSQQPNLLTLKPDGNRNSLRYLFYSDYNGWMNIGTTEQINTWWQTDYAFVKFVYVPDGNQPLIGKDIYISGELTQNLCNENSKMTYNASRGAYEKILFLKQGYYSYCYQTKDTDKPEAHASPAATEGNYWETENDYTIMVYYRSYSGRHDELVGVANINSRLR